MFNLLGGLKDFMQRQEILTDNVIFRMSYMFTTVLLLTFSMIITATQFLGNPIECINDDNGIPVHVINTFCWITSTFAMPDEFYRRVGEALAAPGVGNIGSQDEESKRYYSYYQWVVFILFFQALLCYIPKFLWDMWEGNLLSTIVLGLNYGLLHEDEKEAKKRVLIDYMLRHIKQHNMYAIRYFICEFLALINIIGQLYLMNAFFDGEFFNYGLNVVEYSQMDQEARFDPMVYVFPRVTKCSFHKFGPSGTIQLHDSICILPLNIFNEKSYIFIWFWYIVVAVLLVILILYRVAILAVPGIRGMILHQRNKVVPRDTVEAISKKTSLGDWWVLYMLGRNLDPLVYKEVIGELSKKIETAASNAG